MKTLICVTTIGLVFFIVGVSSVQSQTQVVEGYTFIRGASGTQVFWADGYRREMLLFPVFAMDK